MEPALSRIEYNTTTGMLSFTKEDSAAQFPTKGTSGAAGYDLYACESATVTFGGGNVMVDTGISVSLPCGTYGRIAGRSGLAATHGIGVDGGVIDRDYTGRLMVLMHTCKAGDPFQVRPGMRIAQLIVERIAEHDEPEPEPRYSRGTSGFGSTGM